MNRRIEKTSVLGHLASSSQGQVPFPSRIQEDFVTLQKLFFLKVNFTPKNHKLEKNCTLCACQASSSFHESKRVSSRDFPKDFAEFYYYNKVFSTHRDIANHIAENITSNDFYNNTFSKNIASTKCFVKNVLEYISVISTLSRRTAKQ